MFGITGTGAPPHLTLGFVMSGVLAVEFPTDGL